MKLFFFLNPAVREKMWDLREMAARVAKKHGWQPRFGELDRQRARSGENLLRQAFEEDCDRIVVVAGDGTLHRVVNTLHHMKRLAKAEIAIVPGGTCNDFAKTLGLSAKRMEEAFALACTGKARPTDLGCMDGELFINNAGFGRRSGPVKKRGQSLRTLKEFKPISLKVSWERGSLEGAFYMGLVCNAPFFSNGLHFSRSPRLNDQALDLYLVPTMPKWQLLWRFLRGRLGRPLSGGRVISLKLPRVEVSSPEDLYPQADGEPPTKAARRVEFWLPPEKAMIVGPKALPKELTFWE